MRRTIATSKSPQKSIQISGSTVRYEINSNKCLTNIQTASCGSSGVEERFTRKTNRYQILRKQHQNYKQVALAKLLTTLFERRKRYSFQMVKLVYMFPDDTFSQNISVNSYDKLFYQDQHIHTIVKIYETKEIQSIIWAFINLKNLHKRKKLEKFTTKIENVQNKLKIKATRETFNMLHQYNIKILPQRKTVKIQRMEPINTKVEFKKSQIFENHKTQNINTTVLRTYNTQKQKNTIQQRGSSSIKRIQLASQNGIRVIYPTIKSTTDVKSQQTSRIIYRQPFKTEYYKQNNQKAFQTRTKVHENHSMQTPRTVYSGQTIKRIQPIRTIPYQYVSPPHSLNTYEYRNYQKLNPNGYLVHTVQGNCTINIYNGGQHPQHKTIELSTHRSNQCSSSLHKCHHQCCHHHHNHCNMQKVNACCHNSSISCLNSCQHQIDHNTHTHNYYNIQQRIQYLKHLQQLNGKSRYNKDSFAK